MTDACPSDDFHTMLCTEGLDVRTTRPNELTKESQRY
eukprot:CAMPEP_0115745726 /NCGR_PEP_ID=MMETSP0272-20121206/92268_1 /TAXON_ID=71861 /ORGANISM="Scrippsiella trochoidea, Strain CCMP3099" /LENGTH=36 /DNA_ID= /DNA_START= /DNA_END= /DNA_ORIENTATION=